MHARSQRFVLVALAAALLSGFAASGSAGQTASLRFTQFSQRTTVGQIVRVAVVVRPAGARCYIMVRYADGTAQPGLKARRALQGRVRWSWRIAKTKPAGTARVTVECPRAGRRTRAITIVKPVPPPPPADPVVRASVTLEKQGFSQRNNRSGTSSSVSYGMVLANPSPDEDALDITVLVNAVDATERVIQTKTERLEAVAAASTFALGGYLTIAGTTPVSRLELVVRMGARAPKAVRYPSVLNLRIVPSMTDKGFVKAVEGELVNELPSQVLSRARLSTVLFDSGGNIVGGGSGSASAELPPGARIFFSASSGVSSVAVDRGTVARVSVTPTYRPMQ